MRSALRLATLVLAATLVTSSAKADTIALTGGALFTGDSSMSGWDIGGLVTLEGDRGFTFLGSFLGGIVSPPEPLLPGRVTLRGVSNDIRATVTLDGMTYTDVGGLDSPVSAGISFAMTAMLPAVGAPTTIFAPFTIDLLLLGLPTSDAVTFSGIGTARLELAEDKGFGVPSWLVRDIDLRLSSPAAVPEPATVLLLGSGLAMVGVTRLRSVRRRR